MRASRVGSANQRFFSRFVVDDKSGCWNWTGKPNCNGYGRIAGEINGKRYAEKERTVLAHRASWIIHNGEIPSGNGAHGTVVMHTCDNRLCVNPAHLRLGSQNDNVQDMLSKGRKVTNQPRGVANSRAVIKTAEDVALIRASSLGSGELARQFDVNRWTIKAIRSGRSYRD